MNVSLFHVRMAAAVVIGSPVIRAAAFPVIPVTTAKRVCLFLFFWSVRLFISFSDIGECVSDPCQNGGTCLDEINAFTCICIGGYTGDVCETSELIF